MKRIAELDGLRGIAILMVLIWHYYACLAKAMPPTGFEAFLQQYLQFVGQE